jgi:hypothetical protein
MGLTAGSHLPVTARKRKGWRQCWAGGEQTGPTRAAVHGERRPAALLVSGQEKKVGRLEKIGERRGRKEKKKVFFFKTLFKIVFQTFKLQSNRNPCIRIMMHKHLLFLNYFSDI